MTVACNDGELYRIGVFLFFDFFYMRVIFKTKRKGKVTGVMTVTSRIYYYYYLKLLIFFYFKIVSFFIYL